MHRSLLARHYTDASLNRHSPFYSLPNFPAAGLSTWLPPAPKSTTLSQSRHPVAQLEPPMPLELVTIPCLTDNYAFLLHDEASGHTTLIDVPEAAPILNALAARGWRLDQVLLTHHHSDHIQGLPHIKALIGLPDASDAAAFTEIRRRKDHF